MKEAIEKIIAALVNDADGVEVEEVDDGKSTRFEVRVAESDMGRIIGREGRTVKAIRSLIFFAGQKNGKRYSLDLIED